MATYAIGDIQGCWETFRELLKACNFDPTRDRLWLAGDLVNRGAGSLEVLRYAASLGDRVSVVLGNHDIHLLAVAADLRKSRRSDTFEALLAAPDAPELMEWLANQPLLHHDAELGFVMTHAGIPPIWSLEKTKLLAQEVEQELRSDRRKAFLRQVFGNKPRRWSDHLKGQERYRCTVNYLTRMRFCKADGTLELDTKSEAGRAPKGYAPWFSHPSQALQEARMLFGHWAALAGHTGIGGIHALDTGCVWGQYLTALRLEDEQVFRVAAIKTDLRPS